MELYQQLRPDVVTMDITMRGNDGITAAREILVGDPAAAIIFYTLLDSAMMSAQIAQLAVKSVVRKGDEVELLRTLASL